MKFLSGASIVQCVECGAYGPIEEAGDNPDEPLCPGCSDPHGILFGPPQYGHRSIISN